MTNKNKAVSKGHDVIAAKKVVVCIVIEENKTKSGLDLSNTDDKPETGEVVAFGEGLKPVDFDIGTKIVFRRFTDNRIYLNGIEYNFVLFKDVLGVLDR